MAWCENRVNERFNLIDYKKNLLETDLLLIIRLCYEVLKYFPLYTVLDRYYTNLERLFISNNLEPA